MGQDIWFIDDDELFRMVIKKLMVGTPYADRIRLFDDGDVSLLEIINLSKNGAGLPSLIFLDLSMKHLEGWQMIDLLTEFDRHVNIVIVTSRVNAENQSRAEKEPLVKEIVSKPISAQDIGALIAKYAT